MAEHGVVTEPQTVRLERVLPGPIERVWEFLTDSEKRGQWLAAGALEPREGGRVELRFLHSTLSHEPLPKPSEVTFELSERGTEVLLVLTHRRLATRADRVSVASGWDTHLGILDDRLSGREPRGFWSTHARLEAEYEQRLPHD